MLKKIEGIVIREMDYKEASKIITILTPNNEKLGILVRGARKIKSKLRSQTALFTHGNFYVYYKENSLSTLTQVDILNNMINIRKDPKKTMYAAYISELIDKITKEHVTQEEYELFKRCLTKINEGFDEEVMTFIFELQALKFLGVEPILNNCVVCGKTKNIKTISVIKGGFVCIDCNDEVNNNYSKQVLDLIRKLYFVDIERINTLKINSNNKKKIREFIDDYYNTHTGIFLKSKNLLNLFNAL